jgi:hypothetical protein
MAVPNSFSPSTLAKSAEVNENFDYINSIPIGTILFWAKDYSNVPLLNELFVECNGQTLSDSESVFNGQVIPDLNGAVGSGLKGLFLRGHTESGVIESSQNLSHSHQFSGSNSSTVGSGRFWYESRYTNRTATSSSNGGTEARPHNYSVVFIMRVK